MDVDTIEPGVDFAEVLAAAVESCEVLLAVIGDQWLTMKDDTGRRRLDNPDDFVRLEIGAALDRNVRVIPVLVQDAKMPRAQDLPPALAKLARRHAHEMSDPRWNYDVGRLIEALERVMPTRGGDDQLPLAEPEAEDEGADKETEEKGAPRTSDGAHDEHQGKAVRHALGDASEKTGRAAASGAPDGAGGDKRADLATTGRGAGETDTREEAHRGVTHDGAEETGTRKRDEGKGAGEAGMRKKSDRVAAWKGFGAPSAKVWLTLVTMIGVLAAATYVVAGRGENGDGNRGAPGLSESKIAFLSGRSDGCQISVVNADGTGERTLTDGEGQKTRPDWSPDGRRILFASNEDGDYDIYVAEAEGGTITQLTEEEGDERGADWSPDGRHIVFSRGDRVSEIWVMDADGANARQLTALDSKSVVPDWSEDGRIAFSSRVEGRFDIFVMDERGEDLDNLTRDIFGDEPSNELDPTWGPEGKMSFDARRAGAAFDIYVMSEDGSEPINLTSNPAEDRYASWSPDGTQITFSSDRLVTSESETGCSPDGHPYDLFTMNAGDGSEQTKLVARGDNSSSAWGPLP
jgi:Tol biopolymer transport system component